MLQKIKKVLPWLLVVILLVILLWPKGNKTQNEESIIESQLKVEESLVDSFSSQRIIIVLEKDSSLNVLDTLGTEALIKKLRENIDWYENKTSPSTGVTIPLCPPGNVTDNRK